MPFHGRRIRRRPWSSWINVLGHDQRLNIKSTTNLYLVRLCALLGLCIILLAFRNKWSTPTTSNKDWKDISISSRHLLSSNQNETKQHMPWEECKMEKESLPAPWVAFYTVCILIVFVALAIVCDDFFVPSLEAISEKLDLSEDVAGATFMAAGSSAPELFTSVAGVAVETDVGIGTIVGSAVFNILIIIALTTALAGQVLFLDWRPLIRDSIFYGGSLCFFIGFSWDGLFEWYEALILLLLYCFYILLMKFNTQLMDWMATWKCCCKVSVMPEEDQLPDSQLSQPSMTHRVSIAGGHARRLSIISGRSNVDGHHDKHIFHHTHHGSISGSFIHGGHNQNDHFFNKDSFRGHELSMCSHITSNTDLTCTGPDISLACKICKHDTNRNGTLPNVYSGPLGERKLSVQSNSHIIQKSPEKKSFLSQLERINHPSKYIHDSSKDASEITNKVLPPIKNCQNDIRNDTQSVDPARQPLVTSPTNSSSTSDTFSSPVHSNTNSSFPSSDPPASQATKRLSIVHSLHSENGPDGTCDGTEKKASVPLAVMKESENEMVEEEVDAETVVCPCLPAVKAAPPVKEEIVGKGGILGWSKLILKWILFIVSFPFAILMTWTIPDCSKENLKKLYLVSFIMSVLWIAALSFLIVLLVGRTGCILSIDQYTMGLVIIAIGTSIPDALSSVLVARDGYGDMAVSNAIGSNVFDINLGLGLPFLITMFIKKLKPIELLGAKEQEMMASGELLLVPHVKFGFILLIILGLCLITFAAAKFRLNKYIGICFVILYIMFLTYAFVQELVCLKKC